MLHQSCYGDLHQTHVAFKALQAIIFEFPRPSMQHHNSNIFLTCFAEYYVCKWDHLKVMLSRASYPKRYLSFILGELESLE